MSRRALALALTSLAACLPGVDDEAPIVEVAAPAATDDAAPLTPAPASEKIAAHKKARAGSAEQTPTT